MKALRIITATGHGQNTMIADIRELPVTQYSMMTRGGYIQKTLGQAIKDAVDAVNNGVVDHMWIEVV